MAQVAAAQAGIAAYAKTAFGLRDWAGDRCVGEFALPGCAVSTGLRGMTPAEARLAGAEALVIGVANEGGFIPVSWIPALVEAVEAGLDVISGMHIRLGSVVALREAAEREGRRLIDIRVPPTGIAIGNGRKRTGKRLLTVGTDCALGKKYTALAMTRALHARGIDASFRATGQTGIMIAGGGIPMDAVVSDLFHPGFAGVTLGLLHGSQPDVFVVCHDPTRGSVMGLPGLVLPGLEEVIHLTIGLGRRTNPAIRCGGISLNTSAMTDVEATEAIFAASAATGLPAADPLRGGAAFDLLVDACLD